VCVHFFVNKEAIEPNED